MEREETSCSCQICKEMCSRPCWPTPEEALALINKGYGSHLMRDYWVGGICSEGSDSDVAIISTAVQGYGGRVAPFWPKGVCVFSTLDGLCTLHDTGLKPYEGRMSSCKKEDNSLHGDVAALWDTTVGRGVVSRWEDEFIYNKGVANGNKKGVYEEGGNKEVGCEKTSRKDCY